MNTRVAFARTAHMYLYSFARCPLPADAQVGAQPYQWRRFELRARTFWLHCSRPLCAKSPPKWPRPARGCQWMLCTLSSVLLNLYNTGGALHALDTCCLKPQVYNLRLPKDTLGVLSVRCIRDIAIL